MMEQRTAGKEAAWRSATWTENVWSSESQEHRQESKLILKRVGKQHTLNFNYHSDEKLKPKLERIT